MFSHLNFEVCRGIKGYGGDRVALSIQGTGVTQFFFGLFSYVVLGRPSESASPVWIISLISAIFC